ncbi:MAG: hypothetical protein OQK04_17920, partial [Kangiellaceae bacterium]|nr:hypothetical protein [Kangiellaceae bacterium]
LLKENKDLSQFSPDELRKLAILSEVDEIYIINRNTVVTTTSFLPDLGFELGTISDDLREFISNIFDTGEIIVDRLNVSSKTGIINKYAYYGPLDSNYLIEVSVDMKKYLSRLHTSDYTNFLFAEFFTELSDSQVLSQKTSIFFVNNIDTFPFVGQVPKLTRSQIKHALKQGAVTYENGDKVVQLSKLALANSRLSGAESLMLYIEIDRTQLLLLRNEMLYNLAITCLVFLLMVGVASLKFFKTDEG